MGKFDKAGNSNVFSEVGKEYTQRGNVITLQNISIDKLVDHPDNGEDITMTVDLETSIGELGFIDPIEVTTRGMDEDVYMIVSGRRRRAAAAKLGINTLPCLVRNFDSDVAVAKYVLYANQHRDSDSDPLLRARRYKMHESQLIAEGFKGSKRKEIAKRMGLSMPMADRYEALSSIIEPIWNMISDGKIGISSVHKMATHTADEQMEIIKMFNECLEEGDKLTRDVSDMIIEAFRNDEYGYVPYLEIKKTAESSESSPMSEIEGDNLLRSDLAGKSNDKSNEVTESGFINMEHHDVGEKSNSDEIIVEGDGKESSFEDDGDVKKETNVTKSILLHISNLKSCLDGVLTFKNDEDAEVAIKSMGSLVMSVVNAMNEVSQGYKKNEAYGEVLAELNDKLKMFIS